MTHIPKIVSRPPMARYAYTLFIHSNNYSSGWICIELWARPGEASLFIYHQVIHAGCSSILIKYTLLAERERERGGGGGGSASQY